MAITNLPTPPNRNMTPEEFIAAADAFLEALPQFQEEANTVAEAMNLNATSGTSASSVAIGMGAKSFTATTGKSWVPGMFIVIADTAAPSTNSMIAQVTSYNSGTGALVVDVKGTLGSGTKTAWTISQTSNPIPLDGSVTAAKLAAALISVLNAEAGPAIDDELMLSDTSAGTLDKISLLNLLKVVNVLAEDTAPDPLGDYALTYDTSVGAAKRTKLSRLIGEMYFRLNADLTGANVNTAQSLFGVGITLQGSTVYEFESEVYLSKSAGTTSHTVNLSFGGTATINNIAFSVRTKANNASFTNISSTDSAVILIQTATSTPVTSALSSAAQFDVFLIKGTVSINAGGTFIPQYQLSAAPGGAYSTVAGSYIKLKPVGAAGANVNVGGWA